MLSKSDTDIASVIKVFNEFLVEAAYIVPTHIGLEKGLMDAHAPFRAYLKEKGAHDYEGQTQGPTGKEMVQTFFISEKELEPTQASLYRPKAKGMGGDPRIWFYGLNHYASPNNLLAVIFFEKCLYVINTSNEQILNSAYKEGSPLNDLLTSIQQAANSVSNSLLIKLRRVANLGWLDTIRPGDTGVGATLESALGIRTNSSKLPDYNGIELKAKRFGQRKSENRSTLFAQVPDWNLSRLKSSSEILNEYGYLRGDIFKLYCTVSAIKPNSQGLQLGVDESNDILQEFHRSPEARKDVVSWRLSKLRERLLEKHAETFWVNALVRGNGNAEQFHYTRVLHTRSPFTSVFHTLCESGIITLDHLIKRSLNGRVVEKGPLFKIGRKNFDSLFPPSTVIDLV